jgi:hypothetical protein
MSIHFWLGIAEISFPIASSGQVVRRLEVHARLPHMERVREAIYCADVLTFDGGFIADRQLMRRLGPGNRSPG